MVAIIDINAFKKEEQTRLKIGKKLGTANLNSKFTGSYEKKCIPLISEVFDLLPCTVAKICL